MSDKTMRDGADRLEDTRANADYWVDAGAKEPTRDRAVIHTMQAVFAWKNAAYAMAEELHHFKRELAAARDGWIAVSGGRLPDVDGRKWPIVAEDSRGAVYQTEEFYHFHEGWATDEKVLQWFPLPAPPKPVSSEETT